MHTLADAGDQPRFRQGRFTTTQLRTGVTDGLSILVFVVVLLLALERTPTPVWNNLGAAAKSALEPERTAPARLGTRIFQPTTERALALPGSAVGAGTTSSPIAEAVSPSR